MAKRRELSVVVPCQGRIDALQGLLQALERQSLDPARWEVLLIDDGNQPPLAEQLGELRLKQAHLHKQPHQGVAAARNLGLRHAKGRVALFLDADAVPAPDLLEKHLAAHPEGAAPRAVMGRFDRLPKHGNAFVALADQLGCLPAPERLEPNQPQPFNFFWTWNLSIPVEVVRKAGGFDAEFRQGAWADVELGYRLQREGVSVHFDPELGCGHDAPMSLDRFLLHGEWVGHEWVRFARKHGADAVRITAGPPAPPDEAFAARLLNDVLARVDHRAKALEDARRMLAEVAPGDVKVPQGFPELIDLLGGMATMDGVVGGIYGYTPPERAAYQERLSTIAGVFHVTGLPGDAQQVQRLLESLPERATLVITHSERLPGGYVPPDPRLIACRPGAELSATRWGWLTAATPAEVIVLLDGSAVPNADEWRMLARYLGVSPRIGAVGLGPTRGLPVGMGHMDREEFSQAACAVPRSLLERDAPSGAAFPDWVRAQGLMLVSITPPGL